MGHIALDIETTSLDPCKGRIISVSWCREDLKPVSRNWSPKIKAFVSGICANPNNTIVTQNGVFDYSWLCKEGIVVKAKYVDTMVGSHIIESNRPAKLDALVDRYLVQENLDEVGINVTLDSKWKKDGPSAWVKENKKWFKKEHGRFPHYGDVPREMLHAYARNDALYTLLVWFSMRGLLEDKNKFSYDLNMSMIPILIGMKLRGLPIDLRLCRKQRTIYRKQQHAFLKKYKIDKVGPKNLKEIIFPKLKIKLKFKTEKGNWRFNEASIRKYQILYPKKFDHLEEIIQFNKARTSMNTYYGNYLLYSNHSWIYPTFNLTAAKTGRFSSSGPNLQNVKKKGKERCAFLVRSDMINLHWDYDQIELRLLAHYSQEPRLLEIFHKGLDPHVITADLMEINAETASRYITGKYRGQDPRFIGKQLNYSYWYGMGIDALCLDLSLKRKRGEELYQRYRNAFPDAVQWSKDIIARAKMDGYVEDIFGRRYRPDDRWSFYKLVNYLIQGTAAQVMKIGMLRTQKLLCKNKRNTSIIRRIPPHTMRAMQLLTVHDECGIELPDNRKRVEKLIPAITTALTIDKIFDIPLTVGCKWTRTNWGELKELKKIPIPWK